MVTIPQVAGVMQSVLTTVAREQGRRSGFVQRRGKLDGASWTQTLVFGWLANPQACLEELAQTAGELGVSITAQGLDERFSQRAADCVRGVLQAAIGQCLAAQPVVVPLLSRFTGVYLHDSTQIALPAELASVWRGNGGKDSGAALKLQVQWEWCTGRLVQLELQAGRTADGAAAAQHTPLPAGALRLADLGYFNLAVLAETAAAGAFFLSRLKAGTCVYQADGLELDVLGWLKKQRGPAPIELAVQLGAKQRLPVRLIAQRVPSAVAATRRRRLKRAAKVRGKAASAQALAWADWTLLITNVPPERLKPTEALILAACRWQIELLFKLWKSHARLDESRSAQPWRQLTELYAKLLGLLIQHWLYLLSCWQYIDRSLVKAAQIVQKFAERLAACLSNLPELSQQLEKLQRRLSSVGRLNKRRKQPATFQTLLACQPLPGLA
jgi:Transposase DDE domain